MGQSSGVDDFTYRTGHCRLCRTYSRRQQRCGGTYGKQNIKYAIMVKRRQSLVGVCHGHQRIDLGSIAIYSIRVFEGKQTGFSPGDAGGSGAGVVRVVCGDVAEEVCGGEGEDGTVSDFDGGGIGG